MLHIERSLLQQAQIEEAVGFKTAALAAEPGEDRQRRHLAESLVDQVRALGAQIRLTRSDVGKGHPEHYQDLAARLARETPNSFYVNQFANPANPLAHEATTGPEIWAQTGQMLDAVVVGVGSGGTLTGLSRYFARVAPHVEIRPHQALAAQTVEDGHHFALRQPVVAADVDPVARRRDGASRHAIGSSPRSGL